MYIDTIYIVWRQLSQDVLLRLLKITQPKNICFEF